MFRRSEFMAGALTGGAIVLAALLLFVEAKAAEPEWKQVLKWGQEQRARFERDQEEERQKKCLAEAKNAKDRFECFNPYPGEEVTGFAKPPTQSAPAPPSPSSSAPRPNP